MPSGVRAVSFDAFGTLIEINDKRRPFARLLQTINENRRSDIRYRVMREPVTLERLLREAHGFTGRRELAKYQHGLDAELASIRLRPRTLAIWRALRTRSIPIAVCSNLAAPYGPALLAALPDRPDATVLSYEVGYLKPEPEIYALVAERLSLAPNEILFVGDTPEADVDGPRQAGMKSMLMSEFEEAFSGQAS